MNKGGGGRREGRVKGYGQEREKEREGSGGRGVPPYLQVLVTPLQRKTAAVDIDRQTDSDRTGELMWGGRVSEGRLR